MYEKIILFSFIFCLFTGCQSTRILSDNRPGIDQHRELENQIRTGETELAITGTKLESASERIDGTVYRIEDAGKELEQSITKSKECKSGITEIIQSVRNRPVNSDRFNEIRNRQDE